MIREVEHRFLVEYPDPDLNSSIGDLLPNEKTPISAKKLIRAPKWLSRLIWIAIGLLILASCLSSCAWAGEMTECSYYTYNSCIREGTSGICANGERLNDDLFTCASWDYRFGTLLRVTNIFNNRSVVVRVNDRGPSKRLYRKGRKLDISFAAMDALGGINKGVITVSIERMIK